MLATLQTYKNALHDMDDKLVGYLLHAHLHDVLASANKSGLYYLRQVSPNWYAIALKLHMTSAGPSKIEGQ